MEEGPPEEAKIAVEFWGWERRAVLKMQCTATVIDRVPVLLWD